MNRLTRSLKAGVKAFGEAAVASKYKGGDHKIRCLQCEGEMFKEGGAALGLGTMLVCDNCGMSQLYGKPPRKYEV